MINESLTLPDSTAIPSNAIELTEEGAEQALPQYQPTCLEQAEGVTEKLPLRQSPSAIPPVEGVQAGEIIDLGGRLELTGSYEPATLGSALHAVISARVQGQSATERILVDHDVQGTISTETAEACTKRLLDAIEERFKPTSYHVEYPVSYTNESGQVISGWIDLLVETEDGYVLIDHKASPHGQAEWGKTAISYSAQLNHYKEGLLVCSDRLVVSQWIHFAVSAGLIELE